MPGSHAIADGIAIKQPGQRNFELLERYVNDMVLVSEEEIIQALFFCMYRKHEAIGRTGVAPCYLFKCLYNEYMHIQNDPPTDDVLTISDISKTYASGFQALQQIQLNIRRGEIFALLGPNGAGKTTLISIICGIVTPTQGKIIADGHDIQLDYRAARTKIGLVPQELHCDIFEKVWNTVQFSQGLFGKPYNPAYLEQILKNLSLWDKKDSKIMTLSGGMKRRVMIAKALAHEPEILFLDEPTAGVDVELRREMWEMVRKLRDQGVTIILTTHYIEEAEEMADRIGVINHGQLILVEEKHTLMKKLGKKQLVLQLQTPLDIIPDALAVFQLELSSDHSQLTYTFDTQAEYTGITPLLRQLGELGIEFKDLHTNESSLEDIFVKLIGSQS